MQQLVAEDGRVLVAWDPAEHPNWPPVDENGVIIGDVPWKFFDSRAARNVSAAR
jgi:hypothetical protein